MEVASSLAGVSTFHFFYSTKLTPPWKLPSSLINTRSELVGYNSYALPPVRSILSRRIRCMPEPVPGIADSKDEEIPTDVAAESPNPNPNPRDHRSSNARSLARNGRERIRARVKGQLSEGVLPPHFQYFMDLGLDLEQIKRATEIYPQLANSRVEHKIKPLVEVLLGIGLSQYQARSAILKFPALCTFSIEENLLPTMAYLEGLGIDKSLWVRIISHAPRVLGLSRKKIQTIADYFSGLGVPPEKFGRMITKHPQLLALSLESKIKPTTQFLLDKGFTHDEVATMVSRFANIYGLNLERNLIPKWEFFLQMGYPRKEVVGFPAYFGCSLEGRIKPRFNLIREYGIPLTLSRLLSPNDEKLKIILRQKLGTGH